ncbi:Peroxiredoxin-2 [Trichoplax sp. H2]|uniref:thioredoxin-dependent peroxiredoxin n=1 Tax=Trichoplax adhaerens TaxID=10228 RepID=B3RUE8_TRIAD|nr:expressed hypothetical protein [Trichoplax adhaerens]EDV25321.1 expressed hypothetical protein [Trichoplax adhaerens]RDD46109.1 Peroxiredoxin-2 [Trichoplax sp. H2]|eukprot:XP_002111354.1 expressed hypothetical protein [Trichoplax adhaerens]
MAARLLASTLTRTILPLARLSTPKTASLACANRLLQLQGLTSVRYSCTGNSRFCGVSQTAPDFKGTAVINGEFQEIQLSDYAGKYVVLFFYPMDFTFVCPTEILAFSDRAKEFEELNTQVIACSIDSEYSHLAWTTASRKDGGLGGNLNIPLLADITKKISNDYGVLLQNAGISLRGLFIIDGNGTLRQATVNDLPVGRSVDETLRLVKAFQFTDKHGEVCPANWQPGSQTIKPDPKDSKEYFSKQ